MKRIRRPSSTPVGLSDYGAVKRKHPSWKGFRRHQSGRAYRELLNALAAAQRGLCGYCEIDLIQTDRQVEHVVPQSDPMRGRALLLEASNLIACCQGGTTGGGNGERRAHPIRRNRSCGQAKGDATDPDFLDPREVPALPSLTRVEESGTISADETACATAGFAAHRVERTIEVLGLNAGRLRDARIAVWELLDETWASHRGDTEVMVEAARRELLPSGGRIPRFFTTLRSYFGDAAETVLAEAPGEWV